MHLINKNKMARFKNKFNIRKGDMVIVISGEAKPRKDDNGKTEYKPRLVKEVLLEESKIIVEGVNVVTRHTKPNAQNTKGGIVKKEAPIHISNVMLWDAKEKAPTKVTRVRENGKTFRVSKASGERI
jgi:large subunit ribosomal protein L24